MIHLWVRDYATDRKLTWPERVRDGFLCEPTPGFANPIVRLHLLLQSFVTHFNSQNTDHPIVSHRLPRREITTRSVPSGGGGPYDKRRKTQRACNASLQARSAQATAALLMHRWSTGQSATLGIDASLQESSRSNAAKAAGGNVTLRVLDVRSLIFSLSCHTVINARE